jgi:2-(1,2-epoxy-1,2-dihydrophenyl)acetyl-CoA isomerase
MTYQHILFSLDGGIARITLNRPDRLNSFNVDMHMELRDALTRTRYGGARVLLLTGAGRGFCAGQDLADRNVSADAAPVDLGYTIETYYRPLILSLRALEMPVVCAVNGVAAGAGASIALACDIVLAARSASFIQAFCKLGLVPDAGGTWALPRLVGNARAMGLAMLGDKLSAEQAESWGLIWKCLDDDKLMAEAERLATPFQHRADQGPGAHQAGALRQRRQHAGTAARSRTRLPARTGLRPDYREGVAAFMEKRPATFTGK